MQKMPQMRRLDLRICLCHVSSFRDGEQRSIEPLTTLATLCDDTGINMTEISFSLAGNRATHTPLKVANSLKQYRTSSHNSISNLAPVLLKVFNKRPG